MAWQYELLNKTILPALAGAIRRLLEHPDFALRLARAARHDAQQRHDAYLRDELAELGWDGDRPVEDYFAYGKRVPFTEETVDTAEWIEVAA